MMTTFSVFPKFYQHLDPAGLAALVHETGLDTVNLVVREGYWITLDNMKSAVPPFMRAMEKAGLRVHFATAGFSVEQMRKDDSPLAILADHGVTDFRMDYFSVQGGDVRASLEKARSEMGEMAEICARRQIRAILQLHHGRLITNSAAAWIVFRDLPAQWVGVEIDPGNQSHEGRENWSRAAQLLGEYLAAVGIKDTAPVQNPEKAAEPSKGWSRPWAPIYEGETNWFDVAKALRATQFKGTLVFMPFYHADDPAKMTETLKREVAYLRRVMAEI
ncbi:MAG: Xylose isomerase-like TIM barrel [candidate division BRC1 bacterium ADurb.BinA364]|nr:MAG: Xylose isomerase-like TIM barrel [candidate division BRC1 bacterium ADurb.BinA364]